jgi:hypothetical protein
MQAINPKEVTEEVFIDATKNSWLYSAVYKNHKVTLKAFRSAPTKEMMSFRYDPD